MLATSQEDKCQLSRGVRGQTRPEGLNSTSILVGDRTTSESHVLIAPLRPACFERPPARADAYFGYNEFEAFCLPAASLNRPKELHLPRELVGHDVSEVDWQVIPPVY
jgi:hypothetical protein